MSRKSGSIIAFFIVLFAFDRLTKLIALFTSSSVLTLNPKAFFIFDDSALSTVLLLILVALLGAWFVHELNNRSHIFVSTGAALIVAGALSNTLDRVRYGAVIDWIPFRGVSVFNVADAYIVIGCVLVLVSAFARKRVH
ncbi:MAG: signal peptidase II [Patescibacteria group bacterium]